MKAGGEGSPRWSQGEAVVEPGSGPSPPDWKPMDSACQASETGRVLKGWEGVRKAGMRGPGLVCLAGKVQASVGRNRVRLGHWGQTGRRSGWVSKYPAQRALLPERWLLGSGKGQRVTTSSWE